MMGNNVRTGNVSRSLFGQESGEIFRLVVPIRVLLCEFIFVSFPLAAVTIVLFAVLSNKMLSLGGFLPCYFCCCRLPFRGSLFNSIFNYNNIVVMKLNLL